MAGYFRHLGPLLDSELAGYFRHLGPLLDSELGSTGLWLDTSQQTPLDTVRMILAHDADGRL